MLTGVAQHMQASPARLQYAAEGNIRIEGRLNKSNQQGYQLSVLLHLQSGWQINSLQCDDPEKFATRVELDDQTQGWEIAALHQPTMNGGGRVNDGSKMTIQLDLNAQPDASLLCILIKFQACNETACLAPEHIRMIFR